MAVTPNLIVSTLYASSAAYGLGSRVDRAKNYTVVWIDFPFCRDPSE
jgi:hypothetical protein